jgi:hypothetical protein
MHTAEGENCGHPSEEDGEEDENNLFEEEDNLEGVRMIPVLEDIICYIDDTHSPSNRYAEMTRLWVFELLRTWGSKAFDMVRDQFSVLSRQALSQRSPSNYVRSDLTEFSLVVERVWTWCNNLSGKIGRLNCPRCILACDALACKSSVEVTARGLKDIDVSDFDFDCDLFDSLLASHKGFLDFVKTTGIEFSTRPLFPRLNRSIQISDLSSLLLNSLPTGMQANSTCNHD